MEPYNERRFRTEKYVVDGKERYSLFELINDGVLITDFNCDGEVLDQVCHMGRDIIKEAGAHISSNGGVANFTKYDGLKVNGRCLGCNSRNIKREFDLINPGEIRNVPVMPIFICLDCKSKLISVTDEYVSALAKRNPHLFEKSEIEEKGNDWDGFIRELKQYIISVFAAKRIKRLAFE